MSNITCRICGCETYNQENEILCMNCNKVEDLCSCIKQKNNKKEIIKTIKRHLKGIEKAINKLENEN